MGTPCALIVQVSATEFVGTTVNYDGYGDFMIPMLRDHYNTPERATELVTLGAISVLGPRCDGDADHSFETPIKGQTIYYGRDRGESGSHIRPCKSDRYEDVRNSIGRGVHTYLFNGDTWCFRMDGEWVPVSEWDKI